MRALDALGSELQVGRWYLTQILCKSKLNSLNQ